MKTLLNLLLFTAILLTACAKNNNDATLDNAVEINGTIYPTVVIGSQKWTSVNYNGPGGVNYNNGVNDPVYGKLYSYTEAFAIIPPSGWHLPTQGDFTKLFNTLGALPDNQNYYVLPDSTGRKLMSIATWAYGMGNNKTGYNAVGTGFVVNGHFSNLGHITNILTSSKFPDGENISFEIYNEYGNTVIADLNAVIPKDTDRGSVRFVKNN
jgi:uncharacterized protein (TIGR02145 family)